MGETPQAQATMTPDTATSADNLYLGSVQGLLQCLLKGRRLLIVTGYQDFLSSLSILSQSLEFEALSPQEPVRMLFGTNTANKAEIQTRRKTLPQQAIRHFLRRDGIFIEDPSDLLAASASDAIKRGAIEIRIFDPERVAEQLGAHKPAGMFHAKVYVGELGSALGSANFSRAGLTRNVELVEWAHASSPQDTARRNAAERFWKCGADWSDDAVQILDALLKGVSPEQAVARIICDMRGFEPWQPRGGNEIGEGHTLLKYQRDLIYEANATVYEHSFAFVEAPPGAGKTAIGQHLALTLSTMYRQVFHQPNGRGTRYERAAGVVVAPPGVIKAWEESVPGHIKFFPMSSFSSQNDAVSEKLEHLLSNAAALIVDEAHNFASQWQSESARAKKFEKIPSLWTVCLSGTLVGNYGTDTVFTMHEKRASLNMTPEFAEHMNTLLAEGWDTDSEDAATREHPNITQIGEQLSRFVCRRSRHCVGNKGASKGGKNGAQIGYPAYEAHTIDLELSEEQDLLVEQICTASEHLAQPRGNTGAHRTETRARSGELQRVNIHPLRNALRDLLVILRSCSAAAQWECEHGKIANFLGPSPQLTLSLTGDEAIDRPLGTLSRLVQSPQFSKLDELRTARLATIVTKHDSVVFIAERTIILQYFAECLTRMFGHTGCEVFLAAQNPSKAFHERHFEEEEPSYTAFTKSQASAMLQSKFNSTAVETTKRGTRRLAFTTYQRAEGINLQLASAVVLLGVPSDVRMLRQALGRIDRIDSPHEKISYYSLMLPHVTVPSDRKGTERLEKVYKFEHGADRRSTSEQKHRNTAEAVLQQSMEPRTLRASHLFDSIKMLARKVDPEMMKTIAGTKATGPWGIEMAHLALGETFTIFALRGVHKGLEQSGENFAPPRLVLIHEDGSRTTEQVEIVTTLRNTYEEALTRGLAKTPSGRDPGNGLLRAIGYAFERLTPWTLRPSRTVALFDALASFLSDGNETAGEMFSELSLRAMEYVYEEWHRELDPAWRKAKEQLREEPHKSGSFPVYLHCEKVLETLNGMDQQKVARVREHMSNAVEEAMEASQGARIDVWSRVSVVIHVSPSP